MAAPAAPFDARAEVAQLQALERLWSKRCTPPPLEFFGGRLPGLRNQERQLRAAGRWVAGPTTLLEVLGLQRDEVRNCRVVRWLLDPLAPHGLGSAALDKVLTRVSALAREQGIDTPHFNDPADSTVDVEETRGRTRADIVIDGPAWSVVVEAKVDPLEQDLQGARLSEMWPGATYVYLTRSRQPMRTAGEEGWVRMGWGDLLLSIRDAASSAGAANARSASAQRARRAVEDYLIAARVLER